MEYVYAALLLHKLGKEISEENVKRVIEAAGVQADEVRVKALVAALGEVDIDEALKSAVVTPVAAPAAPAPEEAKPKAEEEEKKEEKAEEEEKKEEEALEGLASLFG